MNSIKFLAIVGVLSFTAFAQNPIYGTNGNDNLQGTDAVDNMYGYDGDDNMEGGDLGDYMDGGTGIDDMWGGDGPDIMDGGPEKDDLHGEGGADELAGGEGKDCLYGEGGIDTFFDGPPGINNQSDCDEDKIYANDNDPNEHIYCGSNDKIWADDYDYVVIRQKGTGIILYQGWWTDVRKEHPELIGVDEEVTLELSQEIVDIAVAYYGITEEVAWEILGLLLETYSIVELWVMAISL